MSIRLMNRVYDKVVDAPTQRVLLVLCDHANDNGRCWPSIPLIAWKLGISERTVIRCIAKLEDAGVVRVEREPGSVNHYIINLDVLPDKSPPLTKRHPRQSVTPDNPDIDHGQNVTTPMTKRQGRGDIAVSPEPPITTNEPSGEPSGALPRNGDAQTLVAVLYDEVLGIGKPTNYKQAIGQAAQLAKAGVTPDELRQIANWLLADPFWSQKGVNMGTVLSQRDKWRASRNAQLRVVPDDDAPIVAGPRGFTQDQLRRLSDRLKAQEQIRETS